MSEDNKVHKFELRMRDPECDKIMTGGNCELLMDGVKMRNVTKLTIELEARGIARMNIEVLGQFNVLGQFEPTFKGQDIPEVD